MIIIRTGKPRYDIYEGSGDWWMDDEGNLTVLVSGMGDPLTDDDSFLLALHEMIEAKLCLNANVTERDVVDFDLNFEGDGQPGDAPGAPYRKQHRAAALIEHMAAWFLGKTDYGHVE